MGHQRADAAEPERCARFPPSQSVLPRPELEERFDPLNCRRDMLLPAAVHEVALEGQEIEDVAVRASGRVVFTGARKTVHEIVLERQKVLDVTVWASSIKIICARALARMRNQEVEGMSTACDRER